jgi:alkylated DNA nucleotide flippase Atl1
MSNSKGSVVNLFAKLRRGDPMTEQTQLLLKVGHGVDQDVNANPISPRQILIVRQEDLSELSIVPGALRENVVVTGINSDSFTPGSMLQFNGGAKIRLTFHCEPCKRIAHLVKSIKSIEGKRGVLGVIITDGLLELGEEFDIQANMFPALSEVPYERFLNFLTMIPAGKVVTYKQVISGIGVSEGYFRAIPKYLQKALDAGYPVHRVLDSEGNLTSYVTSQREKLEAEGIQVMSEMSLLQDVNKSFVPLQNYLWNDPTVYLGESREPVAAPHNNPGAADG